MKVLPDFPFKVTSLVFQIPLIIIEKKNSLPRKHLNQTLRASNSDSVQELMILVDCALTGCVLCISQQHLPFISPIKKWSHTMVLNQSKDLTFSILR